MININNEENMINFHSFFPKFVPYNTYLGKFVNGNLLYSNAEN